MRKTGSIYDALHKKLLPAYTVSHSIKIHNLFKNISDNLVKIICLPCRTSDK